MKQLINVKRGNKIISIQADDIWNALYDDGVIINWAIKKIKSKGKTIVRYYKFQPDSGYYIFDSKIEK